MTGGGAWWAPTNQGHRPGWPPCKKEIFSRYRAAPCSIRLPGMMVSVHKNNLLIYPCHSLFSSAARRPIRESAVSAYLLLADRFDGRPEECWADRSSCVVSQFLFDTHFVFFDTVTREQLKPATKLSAKHLFFCWTSSHFLTVLLGDLATSRNTDPVTWIHLFESIGGLFPWNAWLNNTQ